MSNYINSWSLDILNTYDIHHNKTDPPPIYFQNTVGGKILIKNSNAKTSSLNQILCTIFVVKTESFFIQFNLFCRKFLNKTHLPYILPDQWASIMAVLWTNKRSNMAVCQQIIWGFHYIFGLVEWVGFAVGFKTFKNAGKKIYVNIFL